jgi:hypothetical protein
MIETAATLPTFFVRYEDLQENPQATLKSVFCFLLNEATVSETVIEHRINCLLGEKLGKTLNEIV